MLLGTVFLRNGNVVLRDVDGSEVMLSIENALSLRSWLLDNYLDLTILSYQQERMFSAQPQDNEIVSQEQE